MQLVPSKSCPAPSVYIPEPMQCQSLSLKQKFQQTVAKKKNFQAHKALTQSRFREQHSPEMLCRRNW